MQKSGYLQIIIFLNKLFSVRLLSDEELQYVFLVMIRRYSSYAPTRIPGTAG